MNERNYHPAIKTAVNYWCEQIANDTVPEKLEIFRRVLSEAILKIFDLPEGVIEIYTKVPNLNAYTAFGKPNKPGKILLTALKKAKLKPDLFIRYTSMIISTSKVEVCNENSERKIIWEALR